MQQDIDLGSEDGSELSILEEVENDSNDNTNNGGGERPLSVELDSSAIPDLLEGGVDITEFDDDDLLPEDEPIISSKTKQHRRSKSTERQKSNFSAANGRNFDMAVGRTNGAHRVSATRKRSRSPRPRRPRSPRMRRPHTPPKQYKTPPPLTPPRQYRSPNRHSHPSSRSRSPNRLKHFNRESAQRPRHHRRSKSPEVSPERSNVANIDIVAEFSPVPDLYADASLTEEERQTLVARKQKFSKNKVSSTKKTIKLKKTKKKANITKRLGSKKTKTIKVKSKSPEIVESVALHPDNEDSKVQLRGASPCPALPPIEHVKGNRGNSARLPLYLGIESIVVNLPLLLDIHYL